MSELKPCPFKVDGACISENYMPYDSKQTLYQVRVDFTGTKSNLWISCSARGDTLEEAKKNAYELWNTRHYPPEVQQAVERMKPKKVINRWSQHGIEYGDCPNCICPVERKPWDDHQHCDRCGQALDWREE